MSKVESDRSRPSPTAEMSNDFLNPSSKLDQEPNPFEQSFSTIAGTEDSATNDVTSKSILPPIANIDTPQAPTNIHSWGPQSLRSGPLSPSMLLGPQNSLVSGGRNNFSPYGAQPSPMTAALLGAAAQVSPSFLRNVPETTNLQLNVSSVDRKDGKGAGVSEIANPQTQASNSLNLPSKETTTNLSANTENHSHQQFNAVGQGNTTRQKVTHRKKEVDGSKTHQDKDKTKFSKRRKSTASAASGEGNELSEDEGSDNDKSQGDSKSDKKYKAESSDDKRKSFLERNRQAALKCRQRKKQWLNNLQAQVEYLSQENETLQSQATSLREEIINLKTLLLAHKNCPVAQANGVIGIEGLVPVMGGPPAHMGLPQMSAPMNMLGMPQGMPGAPGGMNPISVPPRIQGQAIHRAPTNIGMEGSGVHDIQSINGNLPAGSHPMMRF
ncbi:Transcription factor [Basidiobolus ranarum]|uniref:Transcription factor n=1 Tax=Basidiobolus ranarum TaxID=34480 RepID=A0ABR2X1P1_9FUNG